MITKESVEKDLCKAKKFVLGSIDENGFPHTIAVLPSKIKPTIGEIYFCTNTSSLHTQNYIKNNKASVYAFNPVLYKGVLLKGTMQLVEDLSLKEKLWDKKYKSAYPLGVYTDPDYCVLKFTPKTARVYFWFKTEEIEL